ncbi:hypothetical protein VOI45_00500 [Acidaminococcus fermentans]|uniref:TrlF family AAA-like ATPase n=1 Tax=Acidaminococcus fermentans TaxID=905 RepID=UPI002E7A0DF5|nr:hypothetical protein [Acidaminococcus fermentans]MEE1597278.1 hypothetical protein [Acidaminococcus fermentans]MEE4121543.1 hypothetical protein [Acidaminococcus fermentans]
MFESGLSYIKADFHLHTHRDKEFKYSGEENSFVKNYVAGLKKAGINLGVITNHNKFDKDEYAAIRRVAKKEGIYILPGVELTVKEGANGIHTLIVFNPEEWLSNGDNHIQTFLTGAFETISNPENRNTQCTYDLRHTIENLNKYNKNYFIIFAHVDQHSGLFEECKGGLLQTLAGIASFNNRVLGIQKSRTHENKESFKRIFKYTPACVEGSDPKSIEEIGKGDRETYLKIGEYSYSAVKFALQDCENRVYTSIPSVKHGYIKDISFKGGKFDGEKILLSPGLNTLIGIRGSGKSALLEIIRYVFGFTPNVDDGYKKNLVNNVLGSGGECSLSIVDKHGKSYIVGRILGEKTAITDAEGNILTISPKSILDGIQYFGQKDLANSADNEKQLIEQLISSRIIQQPSVVHYEDQLKEAVDQLLNNSKIPSQIDEAKIRLAEIEHKISFFEEKGIADKLKKQIEYTKDETKLKITLNNISNLIESLMKGYSTNQDRFSEFKNYKSIYNQDLIEKGEKVLEEIDKELQTIDKSIKQIEKFRTQFYDIIGKFSKKQESLSEEFAEIRREIKDDEIDTNSLMRLTSEREKVTERLKQLNEKMKSKEVIEKDFKKGVLERNEILRQTFSAYKTEIENINNSQKELKISIEFKGDKDKFKKNLKEDFKGTGISDIKYQKLSEVFTDYVALVEDWILDHGEKLKKILTDNEYDKLKEKLGDQYAELLKKPVPNKVDIYYHDKLLKQHSIGQRASALLLFILTQNKNDLIIIDQPEDDLDNKVIYDEVISTILKEKKNMQFIFATHNANIPVLGDAEKVLTINYEDKNIRVLPGNIDAENTHKQIVDIMEGGKDAFERRQFIYESWK